MSQQQPPWDGPYAAGGANPFGPPTGQPTASPAYDPAGAALQHPPGAFGASGPSWGQPPELRPVSPPVRPQQRRPGGLVPAIVAASVVALLVGGAAGYGGARLAGESTGVAAPPVANAPAEPSAPLDAVAVADRLLGSTVTIAYRSGTTGGTGSGFVLDAAGHIVTNNHVIEGAASGGAQLMVEFADGRRVPASIVGRSPSYDLAVIKVDPADSLAPIRLGDSDKVKPGQSVLAVGAPLGLGGTVTAGIVSAVDRPLGVGDDSDADEEAAVTYINGIQTDAPINPGNSGGPLADANGYVIGVNSAILTLGGSTTAGRGGNIGLGFAIPINQAEVISAELIRDGQATYPVIGATVGPNAEGVRVSAVTADGPADAAGLRVGDVITRVAGRPVDSPTDLIVRIRSQRPGEQVALDVRGRGSFSITLGSKVG